ncbi:MAG: DUF6323 family protein [Clostridiaceae bacterium]
MDSSLTLFTFSALEQRLKSELSACNGMTGKYGLSLSESAVLAIAQKRSETLLGTGRVEFGESVIPKLIEAFCDSPYLLQDDYEETLCALTEAFYSFKNDCFDRLTDDELIKNLRACYDAYEGGLDAVCPLTINELRRGRRLDDADAPDDEEEADE